MWYDILNEAKGVLIMKKIFIDMDGVLAEYRDGCTEKDLMQKDYFLTLAPQWNMIKAMEMLIEASYQMDFEVYVLTKVYPNMFRHSVSEKLQWRDEYMPSLFDSQFIMVNGEEEEKSEAIKSITGCDIDKDYILIDDYNHNLVDWTQNGGTAIKYINPINDKTKSFVGNRIAYTMDAYSIYSILINMVSTYSKVA